MNSSPRVRSTCAGNSVIEVLGTIAVIFIFLLLTPQRGGIAHESARKAQAKSDEENIVRAIYAYSAEYGVFPLGAHAATPAGGSASFVYGQSPAAPSVGAGVSNAELFDILRPMDSTGTVTLGQTSRYNTRGIVFFDGKTATDETHPRAGFIPPNARSPLHPGVFMDPWGNEYFIIITREIGGPLNGLPYKDFQGAAAPKLSIGVFSFGKDHKVGTWDDGFYRNPKKGKTSDDIIFWQ